MRFLLSKFFKDCDGATSIEYALIAAFIALAVIAGAQAIGLNLVTIFDDVAAGFTP